MRRLILLVALAMCGLTGLVCGLVNGLVTVQWKLPSFIVTLGGLLVWRGAAFLVVRGETIVDRWTIHRGR